MSYIEKESEHKIEWKWKDHSIQLSVGYLWITDENIQKTGHEILWDIACIAYFILQRNNININIFLEHKELLICCSNQNVKLNMVIKKIK